MASKEERERRDRDKDRQSREIEADTSRRRKGKEILEDNSSEESVDLAEVLREIFLEHNVCSLFSIHRQLEARSIIPPSWDELEKLVKEMATCIHGVYALTNLLDYSDHFNQIREIVILLLLSESDGSVTRSMVDKSAVHRKIARPTSSVFDMIVNELCVKKQKGKWYLKSGDGNPQ